MSKIPPVFRTHAENAIQSRFCPLVPLALVLVLLSLTTYSASQTSSGDFTIVLFPDTQNEAQYYPEVLTSQTQWVVNNRAALNIQAVLGLGDIVNDGASTTQQQNADASIRLLDNAGVPYFLAIGNHDYDDANIGAATRTATGFNTWWGPQRYAGYAWYKGNLNGSNENFYGELTINGKTYLFLVLEYVPRDSALSWAASLVKANPDKEVIVITHSFMFYDGTRVDQCDTQDLNSDNYGDKNWAKFVSQYPNVSMVVSGHITTGLASRRADLGINGNLVNQMLSNYQVLANGGDGWMRLLTFHPSTSTVDVKTYSPYLQAYKKDSANQFTINWHNPGVVTGTSTITGRVKTAGCSVVAGATVAAGGASTTTDSNGYFSLTVAPGTYTLTVSASGYASQSQAVHAWDGYGPDVDFYLNASAGCTLNSTSPSVTICQPAPNATVASPVQIIAGTTDTLTVTLMQVYVDGNKAYEVAGSSLNTSLSMSTGTHRLTVQAYDGVQWFNQAISMTVSSSTSGSVTASPTSLTFPSRTVGTGSAAQTVTVTNGTSSSVTVSGATTTGDFAATNNCASLASATSCTIQVTFNPTASGTRTGTLSISSSAATLTVSLAGTGISSVGTYILKDLNGDGKADVFWRNAQTGATYVWLMNGSSIANSGPLPVISDLNWQVVGAGDFDGDGKADILWHNGSTGENYLWLMNGTSVSSSGPLPAISDLNWQIVGIADFNGDGKTDVLWRNQSTGENFIWLMNGFSVASSGPLPQVSGMNWQIVATGDFDGDGKADILWRNQSTGENYMWLMNGATLANQGALPATADLNWRIVGAGDFDGDGKADVLWRNSSSGENYLWVLNGLSVSSSGPLPTISELDWQVVGIGDLNADGKADIFWRNSSTGDNYLWLMNGFSVVGGGAVPGVTDINWRVF